jgi:hypothetical protein
MRARTTIELIIRTLSRIRRPRSRQEKRRLTELAGRTQLADGYDYKALRELRRTER